MKETEARPQLKHVSSVKFDFDNEQFIIEKDFFEIIKIYDEEYRREIENRFSK